jgi:hypothetical protein
MTRRLLITSVVLVAVFANLVTIVFLIVPSADRPIWPILACAVAATATISIISIHPTPSVAQRPDAEPALQSTEPDLAGRATAEQSALGPVPLDDPLNNKPLMKLVEECVSVFDEIDRIRPSLEPASRDIAEHLGCRIQEILERSGVAIIEGELNFDHHRHHTESTAGSSTDGATIEETESPGFAVGRRVFRRARVKLAEVATTEKGPSP